MKAAINVLQNKIYELERAMKIVGSNPKTESNIREYREAIHYLKQTPEYQKQCAHYYVPIDEENRLAKPVEQ